jgi:hypothetical protein
MQFDWRHDTKHNDIWQNYARHTTKNYFLRVPVHLVMHSVIMLSVVVLNVVILDFFILSVLLLNVKMLHVIMQHVTILSVAVLCVVMLRVVILSVMATSDKIIETIFIRVNFEHMAIVYNFCCFFCLENLYLEL